MSTEFWAVDKVGEKLGRAGHRRPLYRSQTITAEVEYAGYIHVDLSISSDAVKGLSKTLKPSGSAGTGSTKAVKAAAEALKAAASELLALGFAAEIGKVVSAYRLMLHEGVAKAEDPQLMAALNRARLQERILSGTTMADQAQACELLGLSGSNPSATMRRKEERREVLRFTVDGRAAYPFFQFDVEGRRILPAFSEIIALKPADWSDFRLLHWLTRPHLDFDKAPADVLGSDAQRVIAAFEREIEPALHG